LTALLGLDLVASAGLVEIVGLVSLTTPKLITYNDKIPANNMITSKTL